MPKLERAYVVYVDDSGSEARILTTYKAGRKGKTGLYADLLCFLEE